MAYIPATGVVGTDGHYPLIADEPLWRMWNLSQIYTGAVGSDRYVPKIKDWVCDPDTGEVWVVDHLNPVTLVPTLRAIDFTRVSGSFDRINDIVATGPGAPSDVYRLYCNNEVSPATLAVDAAVYVRGQGASYFKIFAGFDTSETTGRVISKRYDASNNFIGNAIPLELAEIDSHVNYYTKCFTRCHCTETLKNDEVVTVVIYADDGHVVYKRQLLVEITNTISDAHAGVRYITDISIESVWLSAMDSDTIEFPLNIPMNALNVYGVVLYSDGSTVRLPVNGDKFSLLGLDGYLSSIEGHQTDLVLRYALSSDEQAYAAAGANSRYITKPYKIRTTNENRSIAVKLFGYPEYVNTALGYRMHWYLLNMERDIYFDVSELVRFSENTGAFEPKLWGVTQRKSISVNLDEVSPVFFPFVHTQLVDIILFGPPTNDLANPWAVNTVASDTSEQFGLGLYGKIIAGKVNFACGFDTVNEWLDHFYTRTSPLVDINAEAEAPTPTHFVVGYGSVEVEYPISMWNQDLTVSNTITHGKLVTLRFIKRTAQAALQLSFAATTLKFVM